MSESVFTQTNDLLTGVDKKLREGEEFNLRGITLPHYPVKDTGLAAALATYNIPFRDPAPFTDDVALDEKGDEEGRTTVWWLGDRMRGASEPEDMTEWLIGAWIERAGFEADHPLHPFVAMRAALDARSWWLSVIHAHRAGRAILPIETTGPEEIFATDKIHAAAILKACGFTPLAFTGRAFALSRARDGVHALRVLEEAAKAAGAAPPQWMSRVLLNYSNMVKITRGNSLILRQRFEDQTLLLTADSTPKNRDKFHGLIS